MSMTQQAPDTTHEEATKEAPVAEKKQEVLKNPNALLRYITILFAVAFLIVLFSLVISTQRSQDAITALNQTSASALQNAEQLQESNRELSDNNAVLQKEITDLELRLENVEEAASQAKDQYEEAEKLAQSTTKAYELLLTAVEARQNGESEAFQTAMAELETMQEFLAEKALARYQELARVWQNTEEE